MSNDPVSWLMIEPGWKVVDAGGDDVGRVEEVVGDTGVDIFNGLSISTGLLGGSLYVPAEVVSTIVEGAVHLQLSAADVKRLDKYDRPPQSEEILPP